MMRYAAVFLLGAVVLTFCACTSQEEQIRRTSFGFRELNLPKQLENDELALKNDHLSNDIAQRQGKRGDVTRIAVDQFMIDQDKAALELSEKFAEIWSYTIDRDTMKVTVGNNGNKELQAKFGALERRFDDADRECHGERLTDPELPAPKTVKEAEARCANLREIYSAVMQSTTASTASTSVSKGRTFASVPAEPGGCVSEVDEMPYSANVESAAHKLVRQEKDNAQQRCDTILLAMKRESAKCKHVAATTDETDGDQVERAGCVQEEKRLSAIGDARYAELNAAVRRLNAVTESEQTTAR
jgi:hypothetical protein